MFSRVLGINPSFPRNRRPFMTAVTHGLVDRRGFAVHMLASRPFRRQGIYT